MKKEDLVMAEVKRLSEKYNKDFLDCEDIVKIIGVGRDNVRALMKSNKLPTKIIGKRQVVSILNFVLWLYDDKGEESGIKTSKDS